MSLDKHKLPPEEINKNIEDVISKNIDKLWNNTEKNLKKKISLSYQWLKELTIFVTQKENQKIKSSLQETLSSIDFSETDKQELNALWEEGFQALTESIVHTENIEKNLDQFYSKKWDKYIQTMFSKSRYENAIHNTTNNISHHIDWCVIWATQSIIIIWKFTVQLTIDTLKLPYHCWLLLAWKAQLKDYNV